MSLIAVVDVESTGLRPWGHDRVVELGAVIIDRDGATVREMATLINPERDVGPTHLHGLTASDLSSAPRFSEVVGSLLDFLKGSVGLAGHNVHFDKSFLDSEFRRAGLALPEVPTICTMRLAGGGRLAECCERFGVPFEGRQHSALDDARAAAGLLGSLLRQPATAQFNAGGYEPISWPQIAVGEPRLLTRHQVSVDRLVPPSYLQRLMGRADVFPSSEGSAEGILEYDDLLSRAIIDRHIDEVEGEALVEMAAHWELRRSQVDAIHRHRLRSLVRVALEDGIVAASERRDLLLVARLLGIDEAALAALEAEESAGRPETGSGRPAVAARSAIASQFIGKTVCFTGESVCEIAGELVSRELAREMARRAGVAVIDNITKKLDFLIVADSLTQSGKAKKARERGIPLVHEPVFWSALGVRLDRSQQPSADRAGNPEAPRRSGR